MLLVAFGLFADSGWMGGTTVGASMPRTTGLTTAAQGSGPLPAGGAIPSRTGLPATRDGGGSGAQSHTHPMIPAPTPPRPRVVPGLAPATSSTNWSGYAAMTSPASGTVSDVTGSWVVPTVTGGIAGAWNACSDWVGIDGYSKVSRSVEQIGTEEDYNKYGVPVYYAWWEMYPAVSVQITTMTISPGDTMTAEVSWVSGNNTFVLSLTDVNTGANYTTQQLSGTVQRSSAEWVHEAPYYEGVLPLTPTTPVPFSGCYASINGTTGPIGFAQWQNVAINMQSVLDSNPMHYLLAAPSSLNSDGTSFTVTDGATPPTTTLTTVPAPNSTGWNTTTVTASMTATDYPGGWSIASTRYRLNAGATTTYTTPVTVSAQGTDTIAYWSTDVAGNVESSRTVTVRIDTTPPHTTSDVVSTYTGTVTIFLTATDAASGVAATYYRLDGGTMTTYTVPVIVAPPASGAQSHAVSFWSVDRAGNVEASTNTSFSAGFCTLSYTARANGSIVGSATQVVVAGASGTAVTATPTVGYHFVKWSDGSTANPRVDTTVTTDRTVSAIFAPTLLTTKLTITANHTTVYRHHAVTFSGTISPNMPDGTHVTVQIRKSGSSTWSTMSTRSTSSSHWSYRYTPSARHGTYYLRARYAGSTTYKSCVSVSRKLLIK
jgi:hypothetical protein